MLDFNHILAIPGVDVQYFTGQGGMIGTIPSVVLNTNISSVTIADTAGTLTVFAGTYVVGQAITISGTLSAGTINGTADYTTPVTFYIINVITSTSIVISATSGGSPVSSTTGTATSGGVFSLNGVLTVTSSFNQGSYVTGQQIVVSGTLSAGTIKGTADYTTPSIFYIVRVTDSFAIVISDTPNGVPVLTTAGTATTGGTFNVIGSQWQTWRKPRGVKNIYMLGVGGGASGGVGGYTGGAGSGGGSGAQTCVWIPAMFVPDTLYVQCGAGGQQPSALCGFAYPVGGGPTYVNIEPTTNITIGSAINPNGFLAAYGAYSGGSTGGSVSTIASMPLAGRGYYTFFAGQSGGSGALANNNATNLVIPATGLMVMGGTGGGGGGGSNTGGGISQPSNWFADSFILPTIAATSGASVAVPASNGVDGVVVRNFLMNYGGTGGGGASSTAGGSPGAGGKGAPGCGGGGSGGGGTSVNITPARPGNGGDGFVIIMSW